MTTPSSIRAAYERGRLRDAALQAIPVVVLPGVVFAVAGGAATQVVLGAVLVGGFLLARWRGLGWGRGAVLGVLAGALPALAAACLVAEGLGCVGPGCASWCVWVCGAAGLLGGAFLGFGTRDPRALAVGVALAATAGALGCAPMGLGVIGGMAGTLAVAAAGVACVRACFR